MFINYYPLSTSQSTSSYTTQNTLTSISTIQKLIMTTQSTTFTSEGLKLIRYTEDDFKVSLMLWQSDIPFYVMTCTLFMYNLKKDSQISTTIDFSQASSQDNPIVGNIGYMEFSKENGKTWKFNVKRDINVRNFTAHMDGDYTIHFVIPVRATRSTFPFKASVIVSYSDSQQVTNVLTKTSTGSQIETFYPTEISTSYSTTLSKKPIENGEYLAYMLWGASAILIIALFLLFISKRARVRVYKSLNIYKGSYSIQ